MFDMLKRLYTASGSKATPLFKELQGKIRHLKEMRAEEAANPSPARATKISEALAELAKVLSGCRSTRFEPSVHRSPVE